MATSIKHDFELRKGTLHPPALPRDDDGAEIPWVLLDQYAYVADRSNATTAYSTTWDGKRIQVTFCLARPPHVSYICVFCPGLKHTEFTMEPKILAVEEDLVLLRIIVISERNIFEDTDYYIYQAADMAAGGAPSLTRLPRPPYGFGFDTGTVGILRCGTNHGQSRHGESRFVPCPHGDTAGDSYVVAALCSPKVGRYVFCHYNSKAPTRWSTDSVSLDKKQQRRYGRYFYHVNKKVLAIGGDAGTMGFVDLWQGILFYDVLNAEGGTIPRLRYVKLPPPLMPDMDCTDDARLARDIAVVEEGHVIKYVEMQVHWKRCYCQAFGLNRYMVIPYGWVSRTWKRPASATCLEDCWDVDCRHDSSDIPVDCNLDFELLPKVMDDEGKPLPPFKGLAICQPTLSLGDDDDTVYFMAKKNYNDEKAWVIAVDMRNNALKEVAEFAAERTVGIGFGYLHSKISKYLTRAPGTKATLKRPGMVLMGSSMKKHSGMSMPPWDVKKQPGTPIPPGDVNKDPVMFQPWDAKKHPVVSLPPWDADAEMEGDGDDMALD